MPNQRIMSGRFGISIPKLRISRKAVVRMRMSWDFLDIFLQVRKYMENLKFFDK
jgi:hypothetical protein